MADERYKAAVEAAVDEVNALLVGVAEKKKLANMLAQLAGIPAPFDDVESPATATSSGAIRSDEFVNFSAPSAAARSFLTKRGKEKGAADLDTIFEALKKGGFAFQATKGDPKDGLAIALGKDYRHIHKIPNGHYGLIEWYPDAKRDKRIKKNGDDAAESEAPEADADDAEGGVEAESDEGEKPVA